jgi:hypothetical protein
MSRRLKLRFAATLAALLALFPVAHGQIAETKIVASDGFTDDYFGWAYSISNDDLLISAIHNHTGIREAGFVYHFRHDGSNWVEMEKLSASDPEVFDRFGWAVAISGDQALISSLGDDDKGFEAGAVYHLVHDGERWNEHAKFYARDTDPFDFFGYEISISGDYALISAMLDDEGGVDAGAAYVFHLEGTEWIERAKLIPNDAQAGDNFGTAVILAGNYAFVGSLADADYTGSVYVFHRNGSAWTQEAKLVASDASPYSHFGRSLAVYRDRIVVGAPYHDDEGADDGAVYVFRREDTTWIEEAKLLSSDRQLGDHFGRSVAIYDEYVMVGVSRDDDLGDDAGSAYLFKRDGTAWTEQFKILPSDGVERDHFGRLVLLAEGFALVASTFDDVDNHRDAGSVYCYTDYTTPHVAPVSALVFISPDSGDGSYEYTVNLQNNTDSTQVFDYWTDARKPHGAGNLQGLEEGKTLLAGRASTRTTSEELSANSPATTYTFTTYVGVYPDEKWDSASVTYTKVELGKGSSQDKETQREFSLRGNFPNPFNPTTMIRYSLPEDTHVRLEVFNLLGQSVAVLADGVQNAGDHEATFDATDLSSGIYFYRITAGSVIETRKLILQK